MEQGISCDNDKLEHLLICWWNWKSPIQPSRGHAKVSFGFDQYRTSRQYDDANGALYTDEESAQLRAVEVQINLLQGNYRMAVYVLARTLTYGADVLLSPADELLQTQARKEIAERLRNAGLL